MGHGAKGAFMQTAVCMPAGREREGMGGKRAFVHTVERRGREQSCTGEEQGSGRGRGGMGLALRHSRMGVS
jgi:hypothetical protein